MTHVRGCELVDGKTSDFAEAVAVAETADVAVLVLGEGEYMSGEAHSRAYLDLPGYQLDLLKAVHNKRNVLRFPFKNWDSTDWI